MAVSTQCGEGPIILSLLKHPWPTCFSAAVSQVLDNASIPNFLWGDLLNWWCGNPHIPNVCGFVVAKSHLQDAAAAIANAGLAQCHCDSSFHHADPASSISLPVHFSVPQPFLPAILFLCPEDTLLNLLPLTPTHPNPALLQFNRWTVSLDDHRCKPCTDDGSSPKLVDGTYTVNALTTTSLIKALLLLYVLSPPDRVGIGYVYGFLLNIMAVHASPPGPYDLGSTSLQRLWDMVICDQDATESLSKSLCDEVKREWKDSITATWLDVQHPPYHPL